MKREVPELSVIVTAHDEGILAHKTMRSIFRALDKINDTYEIVVHIDCGTPETIKYFQRYNNDKRFTIVKNHFGDLGLSRNAAIKVARGKYAFFRDADDLISSNYFVSALRELRLHRNAVVGPQYCLSFEDCRGVFCLQELPAMTSQEMAAKMLFGVNPWVSSIAGRRKLFIKFPYPETAHGYGHEDYALHMTLVANGITHYTAPDTVYFYRRKSDSLFLRNAEKRVTQPYTKLFDYRTWQNYTEPERVMREKVATNSQSLSLVKKIYKTIRHDSKLLNWIISPLATNVRRLTGKKLIPEDVAERPRVQVPATVLAAWKEQATIEMQLFPTSHFLKYLLEYRIDQDPTRYLSYEYWQLCQHINHTPDYVFLVPWIVPGGADKVLLNYIQALRETHPKWQITVIATRKEPSTWKDYLPSGVDFIEFGSVAQNLDMTCQEILLTRLLVQLNCKKIHIINSLCGYEWVRDHMELAQSQFEIYVTLFADGQMTDGSGGWWGYGDPYLARIFPAVRKVFTDNQNYLDRLAEMNAFDKKKMLTIYQPIQPAPVKHKTESQDKKIRILWASRIVASKNPELVVRIAQKLDPEKYQLDIFGQSSENYLDFHFPDNIESLNYCGAFDGFNSLPLEDYDVFLYTSYSDGMPNVVLEAAASGLPIIASNVGGIGNFITHGKTGFLVDEIEDEDKYIEILQTLCDNPSRLQRVAAQALERLEQQHSWSKFYETVKNEF